MINALLADTQPFGALVLIRVRIILDVLRQHFPVDLGCRLIAGGLGIGSFDPTHHAGDPYTKTLGHLRD